MLILGWRLKESASESIYVRPPLSQAAFALIKAGRNLSKTSLISLGSAIYKCPVNLTIFITFLLVLRNVS